jgi:hypothetical protein
MQRVGRVQRQHADPLAQTLTHPQGATLTTITDTTAGPARATAWDRAAIALLGLAGFALSYDALRQMAEAVHVRGALSFLFPLLIDGFIAYGIRALLVLRTAPPAARVYVWALFGSATGASIWANALHAVRINQQTDPGDPGLRLGDTTVGILSTLAPLALAGAVHLYILITRHQDAPGRPTAGARPPHPPMRSAIPIPARPVGANPVFEVVGHSRPTESDGDPVASERNPTRPTAEPASEGVRTAGRPPGADMDTLLDLARRATREAGRITRPIVTDAIRAHGLPLGSDRLTALMRVLRDEQTRPLPPETR